MSSSTFAPRIIRHLLPKGMVEFAIHEVYHKPDGSIDGITVHARSVRCRSVKELRQWIHDSITRGEDIVCGDLGYQHTIDELRWWSENAELPVLDFQVITT